MFAFLPPDVDKSGLISVWWPTRNFPSHFFFFLSLIQSFKCLGSNWSSHWVFPLTTKVKLLFLMLPFSLSLCGGLGGGPPHTHHFGWPHPSSRINSTRTFLFMIIPCRNRINRFTHIVIVIDQILVPAHSPNRLLSSDTFFFWP